LAVSMGAVIGLAVHGPIAQDPAYHAFADQRTLLGIPNFWNVVSNLPFLIVGAYGLALLLRGHGGGSLAFLRPAYAVFFGGVALVSFGSAWYHLNPNDATLAWDRLPMTLAFMAFFAAILGEHRHPALARRTLAPLLAAGVLSVIWWQATGDLRIYALVQFLPVLLIPLIVLMYPSALPGGGWLWGLGAAYVAAKVFEFLDQPVYDLLGFGGHAIKHVAAALAGLCIALQVRSRAGAGVES